MLSSRLPPHGEVNAISRAVAALRARGAAILDLTASNPTTAGIDYPPALLAALGDPRALTYDPHPLGLPAAREAIAADAARRGASLDPSAIVLSASTSESYSWLFKLLCAPGEAVLAPQPSYPLFDHLTRLEGVAAVPYRLEYHGRWLVDWDSVAAAPASVRALLAVSPNNPTGSFLTPEDVARATEVCLARGWALIVDEVFADYPLDEGRPVTDLAARAGVLTFSLGGASKALGLPQIKLGWTVVGGPPAAVAAALAALELIADTYLSVSTPVQAAAASLLAGGAPVRDAILARVRRNLETARALAARHPSCDVLRVDGGWFAPVRVPATRPEETLVLELLERERILVHPGYFFDFPHEAFVVVSLLPPPDRFADAFGRMIGIAHV